MELFYAPGLAGGNTDLPEAEARHCLTVLRHKVGDVLALVDGVGGRYQAEIAHADKRRVTLQILAKQQEAPEPAVRLHVGLSPVKNPARMEWFLEKATEIGVSCITPVLAHRSERRHAQPERWQRVLVAAMKQSGRSWLPELREAASLESVLRGADEACRLIAHCGAGERHAGWTALRRGQSALLLIGPEGDFDAGEVDRAVAAGFVPVHLGPSRLRTETAGVVGVHLLNLAQAGAF